MNMIKFTLSRKAAKRQKVNCNFENGSKGLYVWIGSCGVVDWIVGFDSITKFRVRECYHTGNAWYKDLAIGLFKGSKEIRICLWT